VAEDETYVTDYEDDIGPFRLGWRFRTVVLPDGESELQEEPLTEADLLDPQLGDHILHSSWHTLTVHMLYSILSWRYEDHPDMLVASQLKMIWGIPGLPNPAPDLAVIPGVRDKDRIRNDFRREAEGTRPALVIEVVSEEPEHWRADHEKKVEIYEQAGVPEYLVVDPSDNECGCRLTGYRLNKAGRYEPIPPDPQGRILSVTTGLWFAPTGGAIHLIDVATGERFLTYSETRKRLEEENARIRIEMERLRDSKS
jgi:Uma2 family endonuclease